MKLLILDRKMRKMNILMSKKERKKGKRVINKLNNCKARFKIRLKKLNN
jgi:hypothetical protein